MVSAKDNASLFEKETSPVIAPTISDSSDQMETIKSSEDIITSSETELESSEELSVSDSSETEKTEDDQSISESIESTTSIKSEKTQYDSQIVKDDILYPSTNSSNKTVTVNDSNYKYSSLSISNISDNDTTLIYESKEFTFEEKNNSTDENSLKFYTINLGNITTNQTILVRTVQESEEQYLETNIKTTIEKVVFQVSSAEKNVELSVKNLKQKPLEVKTDILISNCTEIYEYLDIKITSDEKYIGQEGIKSMNFTFTVSKSWIQSKGIDKQTVKMMRYHNDTWQVLNTTYLDETDKLIRFNAVTPGLSIFAVVGDRVIDDSEEIIIETINLPWWIPFSVIFASTAILVVVLVKKRFVYNA